MFHVYTRLDHPSVSVAAIRTNQLAGVHHFLMGVYPYCPAVMTEAVIHVNDLVVLGSEGILSMPALFKLPEIVLNAPAVVG